MYLYALLALLLQFSIILFLSISELFFFFFLDFAPYWGNSASADASIVGGGSPRKRSTSRTHSPDVRQFLQPLPMHIAYDLKYPFLKNAHVLYYVYAYVCV